MNRIRSKILGENATVNDDLSVTFDSGVQYSKEEIAVLRHSSKEDIATIHYVKEFFGGDLEYYGFQSDIKECKMPEIKKKSEFLQYTIGGSLVKEGYVWNKETYSKFKQIVIDLQSGKWLERKRGDDHWFSYRRNFFLSTWNEMVNRLNDFRVSQGSHPIDQLILRINSEYKHLELQVDCAPDLCPIMDESRALKNITMDPQIKIEINQPKIDEQLSLF